MIWRRGAEGRGRGRPNHPHAHFVIPAKAGTQVSWISKGHAVTVPGTRGTRAYLIEIETSAPGAMTTLFSPALIRLSMIVELITVEELLTAFPSPVPLETA